jgi:hypothetical protein
MSAEKCCSLNNENINIKDKEKNERRQRRKKSLFEYRCASFQ